MEAKDWEAKAITLRPHTFLLDVNLKHVMEYIINEENPVFTAKFFYFLAVDLYIKFKTLAVFFKH